MALRANTIAEAFKALREARRSERTGLPISQVEASAIIGVSPSNWSRIEGNKQHPSDDLLRRVARAFSEYTTFDELQRLREVSPPPEMTSGRTRGGAGRTTRRRAPAVSDRTSTREEDQASTASSFPVNTLYRGPVLPRGVQIPLPPPRETQPAGTRAVATPTRTRPQPPAEPAVSAVEPREPVPVSEPAPTTFVDRASVTRMDTTSGSEPASLVAANLALVSLLARSLAHGNVAEDASVAIPADARYVAAATLALDELQRISPAETFTIDTGAAAAIFLKDLWAVAARVTLGDGAAVRLTPLSMDERVRAETFLSHSAERLAAYRRLSNELAMILYPNGPSAEDRENIKAVVLRALSVGARR